uniref:Uncharacterized protein n=1 Tax=Romanomermis culicivorax TaxID=13658 RepID=A0A915IJI0_ROMCU
MARSLTVELGSSFCDVLVAIRSRNVVSHGRLLLWLVVEEVQSTSTDMSSWLTGEALFRPKI